MTNIKSSNSFFNQTFNFFYTCIKPQNFSSRLKQFWFYKVSLWFHFWNQNISIVFIDELHRELSFKTEWLTLHSTQTKKFFFSSKVNFDVNTMEGNKKAYRLRFLNRSHNIIWAFQLESNFHHGFQRNSKKKFCEAEIFPLFILFIAEWFSNILETRIGADFSLEIIAQRKMLLLFRRQKKSFQWIAGEHRRK